MSAGNRARPCRAHHGERGVLVNLEGLEGVGNEENLHELILGGCFVRVGHLRYSRVQGGRMVLMQTLAMKKAKRFGLAFKGCSIKLV